MLFKHPSVLYALFALSIPIIIHLFKLRKFQKTAFTNVAFLKKIKLQSRKSSQLKKWLVLFCRLSIFSLLILAFAFPYLPAPSNNKQPEHYIIYLDNSFSMQAKGSQGPILKRALQDIISNFKEDAVFTLFTNTDVFKDIQLQDAQNEILDIEYTSEQLSPNQILLKSKKITKNKATTAFIVISDFQKRENFNYDVLKQKADHCIQLLPQQTVNTSIDSVWTIVENDQKFLNITTSGSTASKSTTLSVFNGENLIGKASLDFSKKTTTITQVPLQKNTTIKGLVKIENTEGLSYDDIRYFSINQTPKAKVLVIGNAFFNFLQKIYTKDEFEFYSTSVISAHNNKNLETANLIILNEIDNLSTRLEQKLLEFTKRGGVLCVIPSSESPPNLISFLETNFNIEIGNYSKNKKKLTQISFQHPLFKGVFSKQIVNFQYPTINESYELNHKNWILNLEDNTSFFIQKNNAFVFASPLNERVTNFKKSPLIVPVFYNMARQNTATNKINYTIGSRNQYSITTQQKQDNVLTLKNGANEFIPLQQVFKNFVKITTDELPKKAGNYQVISNNKPIYSISYNYNTEESNLEYVTFSNTKSNNFSNSVSEYFNTTKANFQTTELWKWFLIFALFFVLVEIILLKFLK